MKRILLVIAVVLYGGLGWLISEPGGVLTNTTMAGKPIAGLRYPALRQACRAHAAALAKQPLTLAVGERTVQVTPAELGVVYEADAAAARAWLLGRELGLVDRLRSRLAAWNGMAVPMSARVERVPKGLLDRLEVPPQNASVRLIQGQPVIDPERPGYAVDLNGARQQILEALAAGRRYVSMPGKSVPAAVTGAMLAETTAVRTVFQLRMTSRHPGARVNAARAARRLDGVTLLPDQVFSMNALLGRRTSANGYRLAPVLVNGARDLGIGGGICCVSTALWNAAALAGLETEERHAHARVPRYSSPGRDATLNYPNLDLKFKNSTGAAVVFRARVRAGLVTIHVLGAPQAETYRFETEAQPVGNRLRVITYRVSGGTRERLSESHYRLGS